ncbi:hypothetical protein PG996_010134 [Apiospora saccharicola]|uniref:Uncharacterized protein n=1 Tax=Apiospora saccharicola TaxID=335842 RepID=A0ABR1UMR9_9PEZI
MLSEGSRVYHTALVPRHHGRRPARVELRPHVFADPLAPRRWRAPVAVMWKISDVRVNACTVPRGYGCMVLKESWSHGVTTSLDGGRLFAGY